MDILKVLATPFLLVTVLVFSTSATVSTLDSCPDHCYCFVVSRNVPPPTALLSRYIEANDWLDGSKAVACWGRREVPQTISSDIKYLMLIGSEKPKRRRREESRFGFRTRTHRANVRAHGPWSYVVPNLMEVKRRNIRSVPQDAFSGIREIIQMDLRGNKIVYLGSSTFRGMSDLVVLNLNENRLKSLHADLLQDALALKRLYVAGNLLRSMPGEVFRNNERIERLDLSDNMIRGIPEECFQPLNGLKFLNMSYNRVNEKSHMIFTGLSQLSELFLQRNKFTRVDALLFLSNTELQKLDMSKNRIKVIEQNAFQNQHNLHTIDLSGNSLSMLDTLALRGANSLRTLDLSFNELNRVMPGAFTNLSNLTKLYLRGNTLTNITKDTFGDIPSLTFLTLAENNISRIEPNAMSGLERLQYLDLSGNLLRHLVVRTFQGLRDLMELNLADNQLLIIEPEAFKTTSLSFMSQLTWLNLQGNHLVELQRYVFRGAPSLRVLTISRNRISRVVTEAFNGFNRLHRLTMSDNNLERIPNGAFRLLRTLEILDLRNNTLREISGEAFKGLDGLNNLNLAENALTSGDMRWIEHLQSIQTLNLNDNHFTQMSSRDFEVAINLRYLYLSNNNLTSVSIANDSRLYLYNLTLSRNLLTNLDNFSPHILPGRAMDLAGNPWHCDCRLVSFISDMMRQHGIRFDKEDQTTCQTPSYLQNAQIVSLIRSDVPCVGRNLAKVTSTAGATTPSTATAQSPTRPVPVPLDSTLRWSWVVVLWDSATDMPVCNGALVSSSFVLTAYQCLTRITNIQSHLRLVSRCPEPLEGDCRDEAWTAPSNMEIKFSLGQRTMTDFLMTAETYRVMWIHKVSTEGVPDESSLVLLQVSPTVDVEGPASVIDMLGERPQVGDLEGRRVLASGWWIDRSRSPEVVGRQKRRHYRVLSSQAQCGGQNDVYRPFLCGHLEQDLGVYSSWDSLGAPVSTRHHDDWKLIGILIRNEDNVGFIKEIREEQERIRQVITKDNLPDPVTHPY